MEAPLGLVTLALATRATVMGCSVVQPMDLAASGMGATAAGTEMQGHGRVAVLGREAATADSLPTAVRVVRGKGL